MLNAYLEAVAYSDYKTPKQSEASIACNGSRSVVLLLDQADHGEQSVLVSRPVGPRHKVFMRPARSGALDGGPDPLDALDLPPLDVEEGQPI